MGRALRKEDLREEGGQILQFALRGDSDKEVAGKLGITPRHARNLKTGECGTTWPVFLSAAMEYAEVRDWVARYLGFAQNGDVKNADAALKAIRRLVANVQEEGDQA